MPSRRVSRIRIAERYPFQFAKPSRVEMVTQCQSNKMKVERRSLIHAGLISKTRSPDSLRAPHDRRSIEYKEG
jgi:hypothetical protein